MLLHFRHPAIHGREKKKAALFGAA